MFAEDDDDEEEEMGEDIDDEFAFHNDDWLDDEDPGER